MLEYICNKFNDDKGRHEIHTSTCSYLPNLENRIPVGTFNNCHEAIRHMEAKYSNDNFNFDGCYWCSTACHKG